MAPACSLLKFAILATLVILIAVNNQQQYRPGHHSIVIFWLDWGLVQRQAVLGMGQKRVPRGLGERESVIYFDQGFCSAHPYPQAQAIQDLMAN